MSTRTVLIGLDGATFTVLDPLMSSGTMPFLRDFIAQGVRAPLRSIIPALTPPAWTSLATGKRPGQHGVFDFFQKETADSKYLRFASPQDIRSETIWSLVSAHQQRVTALNFPIMFPPPPVNGSVVPGGWMPWRQLRLGCHPPGLFDRLKALPSFNARELAFDMALEEKALEGCADEEYADWIILHTRRERRWLDILRYLMQEDPTELTAVLFDGVDKIQHLCWRFLAPAEHAAPLSPLEEQIRGLCLDYFRQLDQILAEIVSLAGPEATIVMASDHGFGPTTSIFFLNTWLEQQGYLAWSSEGAAPARDDLRLGIGQMARHTFQLDWDRTIAYADAPSSNGIHIVRQTVDGGPGVPAKDYHRVRAEISAALNTVRHPKTGEPIVAEIWTREEAFGGPFEELGPDLTVVLADGGLISIVRSDEAVKPRLVPAGTHRPLGIFLARGQGILSGASVSELSILDVAPLLLYSLNLPVPDDITGHLPTAIFEPTTLEQRPMRSTTGEGPDLAPAPAPEAIYDAETEAMMLDRLRALGYVE